jgi:SAM-dependent methyltransferase
MEGYRGNYQGSDLIVLDSGIKNMGETGSLPFVQGKISGDTVVVSFGGSDPYNLSATVVGVLNSIGVKPVLIRGPFFKHPAPDGDCHVIEKPDDLYRIIGKAGVLITSFGMTMYEALYLGTPVVLFNQTRYHWQLAQKLPVMNLGYRTGMGRRRLRESMSHIMGKKEELKRRANANRSIVDAHGAKRVLDIIESALHAQRRDCLFQHGRQLALYRDGKGTLMKCGRCKDLFLFVLKGPDGMYQGRDYFFSEYKRQYGRSYLEDRDTIIRFGKRRMNVIERFSGVGTTGKLLDVGSALGFFLKVARDRGWETMGVEVSSFAAEWATKNLGLRIWTGSYLESDFPPETFDAVTFFFVAEHFKDVEKVIERTHKILKRGGIIVVALPNRGGISYRMSREKYIENHPPDHFFDTDIGNWISFLENFGFKKKKICVTGIHPERFYEKIGIRTERKIQYRFYTLVAKILRLGDTFEYYGIKT